jgi:ribosomal protein L29
MRTNDKKALHGMEVAELSKKLNELQLAFTKAQLEKKIGKLADRRMASKLSDDIARIKTIITQKEMKASV